MQLTRETLKLGTAFTVGHVCVKLNAWLFEASILANAIVNKIEFIFIFNLKLQILVSVL